MLPCFLENILQKENCQNCNHGNPLQRSQRTGFCQCACVSCRSCNDLLLHMICMFVFTCLTCYIVMCCNFCGHNHPPINQTTPTVQEDQYIIIKF